MLFRSVSFTPAAVAAGNSSVTVSFTVKNLSATSRVGPSTARIVLSSNVSPPVVFFSKAVTALAAGGTQAFTQAMALPALPIGLYNIDAIADVLDDVGEADEGNNTRRATGTLLVGPDLVGAISPVNNQFHILLFTYIFKNVGGAPAGPFTILYELVDPMTPRVFTLASDAVPGGADAGVSLTLSRSFAPPFGCIQ